MMKLTLIFFLLFSTFYTSQSNKLKGVWILDKVLYTNGNQVEINNPLFSTKMTLDIFPNNIIINNQQTATEYTENTFSNEYKNCKYWFENDYLVVQENEDDKNYYFLKRSRFVEKFPEFSAKFEFRDKDTLIVANEVVQPRYISKINFNDMIIKSLPNSSLKEREDFYFQAEFVLTTDNIIKDIKILNTLDSQFDNIYIKALKKSETYFINPFGFDIIVKRDWSFTPFFINEKNKNERLLSDVYPKAEKYYYLNLFEKAIKEYEKIQNLKMREGRFDSRIIDSRKNLAIAYLATNNVTKACQKFLEIGNVTNFEVRNYLLEFCFKK